MFIVQILCSALVSSVALANPTCPRSTPKCKAIPGTADWPSPAEWSKLNASLSGRLIDPIPPGAVCHPHHKAYDKAQCATVSEHWTVSEFHAKNPVSIDYNDDTCFPNASAPCSAKGYASFVVNASCAADVKKGVDFAREKNVRLIIKGTGHDYNGRSSAPFALSIWTHHLRGLEFIDSFKPQQCPSAKRHNAVKIMAGMQVRDIQAAAGKQNVMVVSGADPDVGIGGYLMGGGHSPISSQFGLAPDQALEFEVVTAGGEILTVNECNYKDLFWALRGGGPSTYAVLISVTVRTYPEVPLSALFVAFNTTSNSQTYWEANAYFHSQIPRLSNGGVMGYYYGIPLLPGEKNKAMQGKIVGVFIVLNKSTEVASDLFKPLVTYFKSDPFPDKVFPLVQPAHFPNFYSWFSTIIAPEAVGTDGRIGSRLLDAEALSLPQHELAAALKASSPFPNFLVGHMVAGKGVRDAIPAGGSDAVNPAWRRTYAHVVLPTQWSLGATKAKAAATRDLTDKRVAALRRIAPHMGAYVNEADPDEPDWQQAFWGSHYPRLLEIKKHWDPTGVFYCFPCVGAEAWAVNGGGRLCKKG